MHYATTGLNHQGEPVNGDWQISRQQAVHAYTQAAAWFMNWEDDLGSLEVGKLGDLIVLDRDYFSVTDESARATLPDLTVVGGKIVHDTGAVG